MRTLLLLATLALQGGQADYPSVTTKKTLYAKSDLRGKEAPKITVEEWLSGKAPSTKGKILVIDFWATWCGPCRASIPELNTIAKKFEKDVIVIGVSKEKPEVVRAFMKTTEMKYHVAVDQKGTMEQIVGVEGIPHVLVVTPDNVVRWQGFPLDSAEPLTEATIEQIINASKVKKSSGSSNGAL